MKNVHASIRIKASDHGVSLHMDFKPESTLFEKFEQIHETLTDKGYLNGSKLESIYFFESEEVLKCTE